MRLGGRVGDRRGDAIGGLQWREGRAEAGNCNFLVPEKHLMRLRSPNIRDTGIPKSPCESQWRPPEAVPSTTLAWVNAELDSHWQRSWRRDTDISLVTVRPHGNPPMMRDPRPGEPMIDVAEGTEILLARGEINLS